MRWRSCCHVDRLSTPRTWILSELHYNNIMMSPMSILSMALLSSIHSGGSSRGSWRRGGAAGIGLAVQVTDEKGSVQQCIC